MRIEDAAILAMRMGGLGLLWSLGYIVVARLTPFEVVPGFLHQRLRGNRSRATYVAAASVVMLAAGAIATICARF